MTRTALILGALCAAASSGCDGEKIFVEPTPGLHRMLVQPKADPYEATPVFANNMVMRPLPRGTVPRKEVTERGEVRSRVLFLDDDGVRVQGIPLPVTTEVLETGQDLFQIYCAACHGMAGYSTSYIATRMLLLRPASLHSERLRQMPPSHFYNVISQGYGLMPSYANQLGERERWAVVAYVQALQLSQHVPLDQLSEAEQRRVTGQGGKR